MSPGKGGDAWFSLEDDIVFPLSLFARLWLVPRGSSDRFDTLQPLSIPDVAPELDLFLPCPTFTDISFSLSDEEEWKMSFGSWILEVPIECMFHYNFDINSSTFKLKYAHTHWRKDFSYLSLMLRLLISMTRWEDVDECEDIE